MGLIANWDEALHPRDERGRFSAGDGGSAVANEAHRKEQGALARLQQSRQRKPRNAYEWGASHASSKNITSQAAQMMGIPGYDPVFEDEGTNRSHKTLATYFLRDMLQHRAEEKLYHGFENVKGTEWKVGATVKLPLTATSGGANTSSYGVRLDIEDQRGEPTLFEFSAGTHIHGYHEDRTREFGYRWFEALTAGEFRVKGTRTIEDVGWQHDRAKGTIHHAKIRVVSLEQVGVYDPDKGWRKSE